MPQVSRCPRCDTELRPPGLWSSDWQCPAHGPVLPLHRSSRLGPEALEHVRSRCGVPLWAPVPMPAGWLVTGLGYAGDERRSARASLLACSGPGPLGGQADLLLIAEEPGVGLGARYAGLPGADPGQGFDGGPPDAKVEAAGHPTALWCLPGQSDRAVFLGEAKALWLWAIVRPDHAGVLLYENLVLRDLREDPDIELAYGAPAEFLAPPQA